MDWDLFINLLTGTVGSLGANAITEAIKGYTQTNKAPSVQGLETEIQNAINAHGLTVTADTVISMLSDNGLIQITNSTLYAPNQMTMGSQGTGTLWFGNDSTSLTDKTGVEARGNAGVKMTGNAAIAQNEDGSISFHVGKKN